MNRVYSLTIKRLIALILLLASIIMVLLFSNNFLSVFWKSEFVYDETLTIPLETTNAIYTQGMYNGWVYLRISGLGQVRDDTYSDAFCAYDASGELLLHPTSTNNLSGYGIAVDGIIRLHDIMATQITQYLPLDEYRCKVQDHTYIIAYYVGEEARHVSFSSVDEIPEDNTGYFTVEISTRRPPELRGPA